MDPAQVKHCDRVYRWCSIDLRLKIAVKQNKTYASHSSGQVIHNVPCGSIEKGPNPNPNQLNKNASMNENEIYPTFFLIYRFIYLFLNSLQSAQQDYLTKSSAAEEERDRSKNTACLTYFWLFSSLGKEKQPFYMQWFKSLQRHRLCPTH